MAFLKRAIVMMALGLLAVLIQGTLLKSLHPSLMVPNLSLAIVIFLAFYDSSVFGAFLAFVIGIELDLASGLLLGPWAGACAVLYGVLASLSQRIFIDALPAAFLAAFFSTLLADFIYLILVYEFKPVGDNFYSTALFEAIITAFIAPLVIKILKKFFVVKDSSVSPNKFLIYEKHRFN